VRIVVLTPYLPHARVGHGGGTAVRDLVTHLARLHEVRVISLLRPGESDRLSDVTALGATVTPLVFLDEQVAARERARLAAQRGAAWFRSLRSGYPLYVEKYGSPRLARDVVRAVAEYAPDAVQVEYLQLALLLRELRRWRNRGGERAAGPIQSRPRLILNTHEVGSVPRQRRAGSERRYLRRRALLDEARRWERLQRDATGWADVTICVTDDDRKRLAALGGSGLVTVPLGMDTERIVPRATTAVAPRYLFLGSFGHRPNRVAAELLVRKLWPLVAAQLPAAELVLAGRGSRRFFESLGRGDRPPASHVRAVGYVDDLAPVFGDCVALVAPLTEGGGIKIKVLEAMARGVPVVTTPVGAEGIVSEPDHAAWIVAPDAAFAGAMLDVWRQPEEARRRAEQARRLIEERYSWSAIARRLTEIYTSGPAAAGPRRPHEGANP
jgi:glycosyltransferase involved in cell wall biosynthesis